MLASQSFGQLISTKGKEFWFGFMEGDLSGQSTAALTVFVSADRATSGQISVPGQGFTQNFTVNANSTLTINLPLNVVHNVGSDRITAQGIRVTASDSITLFALNYRQFSSDAAVILPLANLGNDYYAVTVPGTGIQRTSFRRAEVLIVGTENNSVIEITPTADVTNVASSSNGPYNVSRPAGVPYTITLNQGQTYQLQSQGGDLTGTRIRAAASNPCIRFAAYSGNIWQNVCASFGVYGDLVLPGTQPPRTCASGNQLYDQLLPQRVWGQNYLVIPYATRLAGDLVRVTASANGTQIFLNGVLVANINQGQFFQTVVSQPVSITSNQPIQVAQISQTQATDNVDADPFMIILSPVEQSLNQITFTAFPTSITAIRYIVTIVTKTANVNRLRFDGQNISNTFQPVAVNPTFSFARNIIAQGNHTVTSDSGFVAYVYAYGQFESYGYSVGVKLENLSLRALASVGGQTCTGQPINFNGQTTIPTDSWTWRFSDNVVLTG